MTTPGRFVPRRGDIVWIDFDPQTGREQAGHRPAVVLSDTAYNARTGLAVVCPITRQAKGYTHEVSVPAGLPVTGVVLCDQIKSLDWQTRGTRFVCTAPPALMIAVV